MKTRVRAVLGLSRLTPDGKVTKAQDIKDKMQTSGNFPSSVMAISYGNIQTIIDDLHDAILATNAGTAASTSSMHEQERILVSAFNLVKGQVEFIANSNVDPATVITSAGMQVIANGGSNAVTELALEAAGNGTVIVRVPRSPDEKAFVFEKSLDGITYTKAISSSLTKISITGLQPASTLYVRYYAISKNGESATSQAKSIIVL